MLSIFFFKQKTAYEIGVRLVGSEMCIRDRFQGRALENRPAAGWNVPLPEHRKAPGEIRLEREDAVYEAALEKARALRTDAGIVLQPGAHGVCGGRKLLQRLLGSTGRYMLSLIHISEPTRRTPISYAVFCLKKKPSWQRNRL